MNDKNMLFNTASSIAVLYHHKQVDKAGLPYILHPMAVATMVENIEERIVAMLHDTIEDTDLTLDILEHVYDFPKWVLDAVDAITNRKDEKEPLDDYLDRVKANPIAFAVKLKDIEHNRSERRLSYLGLDVQKRLRKKYRYCVQYLYAR